MVLIKILERPCLEMAEVGKHFFKRLQSQIRKFLYLFRYLKSANFLGVTARKLLIRKLRLFGKWQIRKFLQNTPQLCLKTILKVVFLK
jgi:hypothetical protein